LCGSPEDAYVVLIGIYAADVIIKLTGLGFARVSFDTPDLAHQLNQVYANIVT
jgi:hypothetical protein